MRTNDEMCCYECGETDNLIEYHLAGWEVNADYQPTPDWGGIDYPIEYIWCASCESETEIELHENWCERKSEDE